MRANIGAVACFKTALVVKACRKPVGKDSARDDEEDRGWRGLHLPATIEDPAVLSSIGERLKVGYPPTASAIES